MGAPAEGPPAWTWRIATVRGTELRAHVSVLATVALVVPSLALDALPALVEDQSALAYWLTAVALGAAFFASLLAHELHHARAARRVGVAVPHITLWLLGGAAAIAATPRTPADERRIAGAGPLMSGLLALGAGVLAVALGLAGAPDLLTAAFGWLAVLNVMLAGFNLLPVFPLDGGRLLVAHLWQRSGDRRDAVRRAAAIGDQFGLLLMVLGVLQLLAGAAVGGLWLVFLGWFVRDMGRREAAQVDVEAKLGAVTVADVMTPAPRTVEPGLGLPAFVELLLCDRHVAYPVVGDRQQVIGLVGIDDVRRVPAERRAVLRVVDVAAPLHEVVTVAPGDPALDLLSTIGPTDRRAVVVDRGRPVGIVSRGDLLRVLAALELRAPVPPPVAAAPPAG